MFPTNKIFGSHINNLELYPRRRATEFYRDPQPLEEYQSRQCEHPYDKLQIRNDVKSELRYEVDNKRIAPPRNSDMRMFRNSYFS